MARIALHIWMCPRGGGNVEALHHRFDLCPAIWPTHLHGTEVNRIKFIIIVITVIPSNDPQPTQIACTFLLRWAIKRTLTAFHFRTVDFFTLFCACLFVLLYAWGMHTILHIWIGICCYYRNNLRVYPNQKETSTQRLYFIYIKKDINDLK